MCEHFLVLQAVILESNVKSPQIGLQALSKGLKQKGIAKKLQVKISRVNKRRHVDFETLKLPAQQLLFCGKSRNIYLIISGDCEGPCANHQVCRKAKWCCF